MNTREVRKFLEDLNYGPAPEAEKAVKAWLDSYQRKFNHYINGEWQAPSEGGYLPTINPATGEVLAEVALGGAEDVNKAMEAGQAVYPSWSRLPGYKRAKYLYAIARAIAKNARLFAVLESLDNGKTIRETRDIDVPLAIRHFYYYAGWAQLHQKEYPDLVPKGVIAQIIPWNFPFLMLAWKIAPAIAVGNTVVLKPSKFTPMTALMFAEMLKNEVGLPAGVVNIVTGDGGRTGGLMVKHPISWKIAFTGSTEAGRMIRKQSAGSGKKLTMELGGKSPMVVFANADIDSAIEGVVNAIWFNQGEVCCAGSRLFVEEKIYDEFIRRLKVRMNKLRVGYPLDKAMDMGAINNEDQLQKIKELVEIGKAEGAEMYQPENWLVPDPRLAKGFFFPPTIFTNVAPSHAVAQEEFFGPVLVCMSFRTPAEAVQLANNTRYGLAASVWTQDVDTALDVARQIKAGSVWTNDHNLFDAAAGFGGYRESGYGREGGRENLMDVMMEKEPDKPVEAPKPRDTCVYAQDRVDRTYRFYINGKLVRPDGAVSYPVVSPLNNRLCGMAPDANRKDVRNAVEAARKAADSWQNQTAHLRAQILYFLAENLSSQTARFAETVGETEVKLAVERLFLYAALCDKYQGTVQPVNGRYLVNAVKEPIGVMGIRASDDYPLLGLVSVLAPAIAMGNTVVLVAGRYATVALDFIQTLQNSDIPAGVVNILSAKDPDAVAKILAEHEDVDSVWFFGSKEGSTVVELASVHNMKRTWVSNGKNIDWTGLQGESNRFLHEATQIKNIWLPYGV